MSHFKDLVTLEIPYSDRPSKQFMHRIMFSKLRKIKYSYTLDIGCADLKLRKYFDSRYVGVDSNQLSIDNGLRSYIGDPSTNAICLDIRMSDLDLATERFDLIVCTHLMHWLTEIDIINVISLASKNISPGGQFFLQMQRQNLTIKIKEEIEKNFFVISELHYRNIFSVVIEKWMFGGGSGSFVKTGFTVRLLRRLSIISEYLQLIPKNSEGEVLFVLGCLH